MTESLATLPQNVDLLLLGERRIYLVGTAHVSRLSVELVEQVVRDVRPESVAIELCSPRYDSLRDPEQWRRTDIVQVIRSGRTYVLIAQLLLASFQKRLGRHLDVRPGAEMLKAAAIADEIGAKVVLADRDIRTTLKRTWASLSMWNIGKLLLSMLSGLGDQQSLTEIEIERLKSADALDEVMKEFSTAFPEVRTVLVDERDRYLAAKIAESPGNTVVAVLGAGHVPGVKRWIYEKVDTKELEVVPPPRLATRVIGWTLPLAVVAMIVYGSVHSGSTVSAEMVKSWVLATSISAALGAAVALAHPLSILAAFVSAPVTSLHPLLASGWFAGMAEAILRKPRVQDFETITDDVWTVRGVWRNGVSRILLVVALTNVFGSIGAIFGVALLASLVR